VKYVDDGFTCREKRKPMKTKRKMGKMKMEMEMQKRRMKRI